MQIKTKVAAVGGAALIVLGLMIVAKPAITAVFSTPVHDVDNGARQPVTTYCTITLGASAVSSSCNLYTVPAGNRLVIDTISAWAESSTGERAQLQVAWGSVAFYMPVQWMASDSLVDDAHGAMPVELYVDQNTSVAFYLNRLGIAAGSKEYGTLMFSGHLVSLP